MTSDIDLGRPQRIHVIGIGGAGMSGIATILLAMGHTVTGSDTKPSDLIQRLRSSGASITVGHAAELARQADVVTASTAIPATDPERVAAEAAGIPVLTRAEMLAAVCATRRTIAVAGTKGKTTTTAMLAAVLQQAGWRPSYLVGGVLHGADGGAAWETGSDWFVVEADESDGTFLALGAEAVLVTNVLPDHLDYYGDVAAMETAFVRFAQAAPGPRAVCADDPGSAALAAVVPSTTYGDSAPAEVRMSEVTAGRRTCSFDVERGGQRLGRVGLQVPGLHNARNACGALALALDLGVGFSDAASALAGFREVGRRFEWRGERDGVTFVDDYAHLPSAVAAVLQTARDGGWERVVAVFQPHRYSRTESLAGEFADSFAAADLVVLSGVYGAGEEPRAGITGRLILDAVAGAHPDADVRYVEERADLAAAVAPLLRPGDLLLSLGAGDLNTLPDELLAMERWS